MKTLALILCLIAAPAAACDGIAFSQGACYSQAIVAKQVVPHYQQPIVLPLNQYAYGQPEAIVLPQKVQIVRPETVLRLEQVHGYQQPVVLKQQVFRQQVGHAQAVVVQKQVQRHGLRQRFLGSRSRSFSLSITRQRN